MKAFRGLRERLQESWQQAAERDRAERIIKASGNIIRLADVRMPERARRSTMEHTLGEAATGRLLIHPTNIDAYTDYRFLKDERALSGGAGPFEAEIIPFPENRQSDISEYPHDAEGTYGELIVDSRMSARRVYLRGYHRSS